MRTAQAAVILVLSLITLGISYRGWVLSREAAAVEVERIALEREVEEAKELSALKLEQVAMTYRLKKLYGAMAQRQAAGAEAEELEAMQREIFEVEQELTAIRRRGGELEEKGEE